MIGLPADAQVWLAAGITDMRRGMHGLAALVQGQLAWQLYSGHVFVFRDWYLSLTRRSQRTRLSWRRMNVVAAEYLPMLSVLHPWPEQRFSVNHL